MALYLKNFIDLTCFCIESETYYVLKIIWAMWNIDNISTWRDKRTVILKIPREEGLEYWLGLTVQIFGNIWLFHDFESIAIDFLEIS